MRKPRFGSTSLATTALLFVGVTASGVTYAPTEAAGRSDLAASFEDALGADEPDVRLRHRGPGYEVRLGAEGAVVVFRDGSSLRLSFDPAGARVAVEGIDVLEARAHEGTRNDPAHRRTDIPLFGAVRYRGRQEGADLEIRATETGLELALAVPPGAGPDSVRWAIQFDEGNVAVEGGRAIVRLEGGTATLTIPGGSVWPSGRGGLEAAFPGEYSATARTIRATLDLAAVLPSAEPPAVDRIRLAIDEQGQRYVAGFERRAEGFATIFVAKIGSNDTTLSWVSRFDVGELDGIDEIGVAEDGRVAVRGGTNRDAWVAAISADGAEVAVTPVAGEAVRDRTPEFASPLRASATIDARVATRDGGVLVAGTTKLRRLEGGTIVGPTASGESAFLAFMPGGPAAPLAAGCPGTINFDNSAGTGAWTTTTNWDLDRLPLATDDVCIGSGFSVTLSSGAQSVQSLTTQTSSALTLSAGTLTLAAASTIGGSLTMSGGTLDGAGDLTISGAFTWNGGAMAGGGTTFANGGMTIGGASVKDLNPRALQNAATVNWSGTGSVRLGGGASVQNDGTWIAQSDAQLAALAGSGAFTNAGTFRKSAGAGTTTIGTPFDSSGTIEVQSGTLSINGPGTTSGAVTGSAGTTLRFNGAATSHTLTAASSVSVPTVVFDAGTIDVNGAYSATSSTTISGAVANFNATSNVTSIGSQLTISSGTATFGSGETIAPATTTLTGGTLTGTDTVTISGLLTWTGGAMTGGAVTNANGGIAVGGASVKDLNPRVLRSPGAATWTGTGGIRIGNGASIENSGTWDAQSDASLSVLAGGGTFTNTGTFRKSAGAGTTTLAAVLDSSGGLEIQSGTLSLTGNGTVSGPITGSASTTLRFVGAATTLTLEGTSSVNVASFIADSGTVNVNGSYAASSGTTVSGATANFNASSTVTTIGPALTISSGTANFSSGETILPSTLTLSGGTLTGGDAVTVSGTTTWSAGAMAGGTTTNANGGLTISGPSVKDLNPRTLRNGATASWSGTGSVRLGSGATIQNDGVWNAQSDASVSALSGGGSFVNAGTFRKSAGSGTTSIGVSLDSPGGIELQSGTVSVDGGGTIAGGVTGTAGTALRFNSFVAPTSLTAASSVAVPAVAFDGGSVTVSGGYSATTGTSVAGATVTFDASSNVTSIGAALAIAGGTATFTSGEELTPSTLTLSSGTLQGTDTVTVSGLTAWTGGAMAGGGVTNANGGVAVSGASVKDLSPRLLRTAGTTTWTGTGPVRLGGAATIENNGTWDLQSDAMLNTLSGGGTFSNLGTFRKSSGSGSSTVVVPFSNGGAVEALAQTLAFAGGYTQTAGSTTLNGGTVTATGPLDIQGGSLRGSGATGVAVTSSGTTSPGLSPGTLGIGGSWTQYSGGTYAVELGGVTPGSQHDRLDVASTALLDGTLDVAFAGGFTPVVGDAFTILTFVSRTGTFATANLPALGPGQIWNVNYKPTSVELKVVPLPSGRVPGDLTAEPPLTVAKNGANLTLAWSHGCLGSDNDSEVYEGSIGNFTSHVPVVCSTGGATSWTLTPGGGNRYYLVVPTNGAGEGSYGLDATSSERPVSASACRVQSIAPCP